MALKGEAPRSSKELEERYGLPSQWSSFYTQEAPFFKKIRECRNAIEHHGLSYRIIFATDKGFGIDADHKLFLPFKAVWTEEMFQARNLAPLRVPLAFVIKESLSAMDRFADMLSKAIILPREIAPGYSVFMTGTQINMLTELADYIERALVLIERGFRTSATDKGQRPKPNININIWLTKGSALFGARKQKRQGILRWSNQRSER